MSQSEIARLIGRDKGTISRELRRNALPKTGYTPVTAERMALGRRHRKGKSKIERSSSLREIVHEQLTSLGRSPEQIAGRLKLEQGEPVISHKSIYRFIYSYEGRKEKLHRYLPQAKSKHGRRARKGNGSFIPNRVSIHERPAIINDRSKFGHWEGVTLHLIVIMRWFAHVTAAYLRIFWRDIINYAAIMIMSWARVECRAWSWRVR